MKKTNKVILNYKTKHSKMFPKHATNQVQVVIESFVNIL